MGGSLHKRNDHTKPLPNIQIQQRGINNKQNEISNCPNNSTQTETER